MLQTQELSNFISLFSVGDFYIPYLLRCILCFIWLVFSSLIFLMILESLLPNSTKYIVMLISTHIKILLTLAVLLPQSADIILETNRGKKLKMKCREGITEYFKDSHSRFIKEHEKADISTRTVLGMLKKFMLIRNRKRWYEIFTDFKTLF